MLEAFSISLYKPPVGELTPCDSLIMCIRELQEHLARSVIMYSTTELDMSIG